MLVNVLIGKSLEYAKIIVKNIQLNLLHIIQKAGVEKTYVMIRSSNTADCGIFEYKWDEWSGAGCCIDSCCMLSNCSGMPFHCGMACSQFMVVADFLSAMVQGKYTNPLMCVGCLYRMSPKENPFWSITVYNHTTTEWDRFTSDDLLTWTSVAPDFSCRPTTRAKFETFDNCMTRYNNVFLCSSKMWLY